MASLLAVSAISRRRSAMYSRMDSAVVRARSPRAAGFAIFLSVQRVLRGCETADRARVWAGIERANRLVQNPVPLIQDAKSKGLITQYEVPQFQPLARLSPLEASVASSGTTLSEALNRYDVATEKKNRLIA